MKRISFPLLAALFVATTANAQQIGVVSATGTTTVFDDINAAILSAEDGSTLYLPGGGFQIKDDTKITKKLTIMGIGHKANGENADGNTMLSGDLRFAPGSDGSALMGVYMSNNIRIGVDGKVSNILVRYCNANEIYVDADSCQGIVVNQNYFRNNIRFGHSNAHVTNNVANGIGDVKGGFISNNIFTGAIATSGYYTTYYYSYHRVNNSTVTNNVRRHGMYESSGNINENDKEDDFTKWINAWNGIGTTSDFHFNDTYDGDRTIGIYGGTGFSDDCLPPMPYIASKSIAEQTDEQGKLKIQVSVKSK